MENKQTRTAQGSPSMFSRVSSWLFTSLKSGVFGYFFTSYEKTNEKFTKAISKRKGGERRTKRTVARTLERNPFVKVVPRVQDFLLRVSMRSYGIILFTMAIFTCALFFIQDYVSIINSSLSSLITGIVLVVISLPMMASKKPIAKFLFSYKIPHAVIFNFLGLRDDGCRDAQDDEPYSSPSISLLAGMILSVISYFISPLWTLAIIGILILAYQVLVTPEAGIIVVILSLPFTSTLIMSIMGLYVTVCYIIKCVVGRRTFKFEFIDLFAVLVVAVFIYSGFVSFDIASSIKDMLLTVALMSSFFVVSNLVRSKEWYKRCIVAICISSTITSAIGIAQFVLGRLGITWGGMSAFAVAHDRASATFASADALALYLIVSLAFLLLFVFSGKSVKIHVIGMLCSLINITALVLTFSKLGYIGAIAMLIAFLLIFHRNTIYLVLLGIATVVILHFGLPEQAIDMLSSIVASPTSSHAYRVELFRNMIEIIKARPFGIGTGHTAFSSAYASIIGGEAVSDSGNLYIQCVLDGGIIGLIICASFIVVFFRLCFSYAAKAPNNLHRINALAGLSAVIGILTAGFFGSVFEEKTILVITCIAAALCSAYIRIEHESYGAPKSIIVDFLSAEADIELDKDAIVREYIPKRKYVHISRKKANRLAKEDGGLEVIKDNEINSVMYED